MYLTDGSWFQVSCMAVRVDRTVSNMADQEEENNMEATGDTYAQTFHIPTLNDLLPPDLLCPVSRHTQIRGTSWGAANET